VSCVAFSQIARQSSLPGKNASSALCRALGQNAHGKGGAVRIPVFAVRRRRTAKSAIPVVNPFANSRTLPSVLGFWAVGEDFFPTTEFSCWERFSSPTAQILLMGKL
jgi:hypothetical protein